MAMTKEELQNLSDEQEVMYIELKDPITGKKHSNWINWVEYRKNANFYARLENRPIPYPEVEPEERPKSTGIGLLEQITNKTYYGR